MGRQSSRLAAWIIVAALVLTLSAAGGCKKSPYDKEPEPEATGANATLDNLLPKSKELNTWVRGTEMQHYAATGATAAATPAPGATLDLAASPVGADVALFQEYGQKISVVQQYIKKDSPVNIVVQIHDLGEPDDAFGLFSVRAAGERVAGGWLAGKKAPGTLSFVKGRYYVIVTEEPNPEAKKSAEGAAAADPLPTFAEAVAAKIFAGNALPALLERMPTAGIVAGSELYLHGPLALDRPGVPLDRKALARALGLGGPSKVTVAVATYRPLGGNANTVFVASYPSAQEAETAAANVATLVQSGSAAERNAVAATAVRNYIVGTFNAEEESVQRVLPKVIADLGG